MRGRRVEMGRASARGQALVVALAALVGACPVRADGADGVHFTFEELLDRRDQRARGERLEVTPTLQLRSPLRQDALHEEVHYSPDLATVFTIRSPGFLPDAPEYYLYEGAYYVYDPRPYSDPSLRIVALPREVHQEHQLGEARRQLEERMLAGALAGGGGAEAGQGLEMTVMKALPGPLATMFGPEATTIRVTGREAISFAGESRLVSPYIATEQGRGQSLFPRLDMQQDLQVKLEGNVGGKLHLSVDHNSSATGTDANRINIYYQGYEDDIVRRIDLGGTNLNLPGSGLVAFSGGSQGLFGVKSEMRLGGLDLTVVASKEQTETETRTLTPSGGSSAAVPIAENGYARDRFYFYTTPSLDNLQYYSSYGINPALFIVPQQTGSFDVFIDDQSPGTRSQRNVIGRAVADLPPGLNRTQMDALYAADSITARWPQDPADTLQTGWRKLGPDEVGFVEFIDAEGNTREAGFFLRRGPLGGDDALAVAYTDPFQVRVGFYEEGVQPRAFLRLIRHPNQEAAFERFPTSILMMRHVYDLGQRDIQDVEVRIETRRSGVQNPGVPQHLPSSTYLHMFGLDNLDTSRQQKPDGRFDSTDPNLWSRENGFLYMPGLRPFSPPPEILVERLVATGIPRDSAEAHQADLFGPSETVDPSLYTLPSTAGQDIPQNIYQFLVRTSGTETQIVLPQDIVPESEVVRLDGRQLQRGVDYDIDPVAGGKITLKGAVLNDISTTSKIDVSYQYRPLFGGGQGTLLGASGEYKLGQRGRIASILLYESQHGLSSRTPRLGEEPTRMVVGDVNGQLRFQPDWMTRILNLLPFTHTKAPTVINMTGEYASSVPNPNTKNTAFVDDLEGADDSFRVGVNRTGWYWASTPVDSTFRGARADTLDRVPVAFYNPFGEVKRGHLNPLLNENEANDGLTVLELGYHRSQARRLIQQGIQPSSLWSGVMTAFGGNGLDLTQTRTIEFWFNDDQPDPARRHGKMHIDFGTISEDFIYFQNNPNRLGGPLTNPRWNREAETEEAFQPAQDDLGWNGRADNCDGIDDKSTEEEWPVGDDCHIPAKVNKAVQHPWANGTEKNNVYDTEDINGNGTFDTSNSYFQYTLDLADPTWVETDVSPTYGGSGSKYESGFRGWRRYRIDFDRIRDSLQVVNDPGQVAPSLRQVRYLRIWFDDPQATAVSDTLWLRDMQLFDFKFTGNQWLALGVFASDSTRVSASPGESYSLSVINNKDNPEYTLPPDAKELSSEGIQSREQSLRFDFANLAPGHEMVAQRTNPGSQGLDFTLYNRMDFFTNYKRANPDSVEFFYRMGTDSLNYYEVSRMLPGKGDWLETLFDLQSVTDLKFPEDVGASVDTLHLGGGSVVQASHFVTDLIDPTVQLKVTRRGNPSLKTVTRLFVGVRHPQPASVFAARPLSGELWFDNVRLEDVERNVGVAQNYSVQGNFAEVFDWASSYSMRDADFLGLRQRTGSGSETLALQHRVSTDVARLLPTFGFVLPVSYSYGRNVSRPKFFSQSDTENSEVRADEQRTEGIRRSFGFSVSKNPSKFVLFKPTLDRLSFSYNQAQTENRTYTTRDTSTAWTQNLNYDLSPTPRDFRVGFGERLNLLPTNIKFSAQHARAHSNSFNIPDVTTGTLVHLPASGQRTLNLSGSAAMRPLPFLSARYNFNEPRDYRAANPANLDERVQILGFDLGIPVGKTEALAVDLTPRLFRYSYTANYGDRRLTPIDELGNLQPDKHTLSSSRSHLLSFDFGLHRRLGRWGFLAPGQAPPNPPPSPQPNPPPNPPTPANRQPPPGSQPPPGQPPPEQQPPGQPPEQRAAPGEEGEGAPPDSTAVPPQTPPPQSPAPRRGQPVNPVKAGLRFLAGIDPVKVEYSNTRSAGYTNVTEEAVRAFRFGFTTDSGVPGYGIAPSVQNSNRLELHTAVPLRGSVRVNVRYTRRQTDQEDRSGRDSLLTVLKTSGLESTFPSLDLSINNLQKLRIFSSKLQNSTLSLGFDRTTSEGSTQYLDADGQQTRPPTNQRDANAVNVNMNWTGQWKRGVTTTFTATQNSSQETTSGSQRREGTRRQVQGNLRFRVAPQGGLKLPIFGTLKTGMDVLVNGSYSSDNAEIIFLNGSPSLPQQKTHAIGFGVNSNYSLSRNINGGLELGYNRNRNDHANQTITTVRVGVNLTFTF